jgi:hypothetical protein
MQTKLFRVILCTSCVSVLVKDARYIVGIDEMSCGMKMAKDI